MKENIRKNLILNDFDCFDMHHKYRKKNQELEQKCFFT